MNWVNIWLTMFGTTQLLGLDLGFWISMGAVSLLVVIMNVVFWNMKPAAGRAQERASYPPDMDRSA